MEPVTWIIAFAIAVISGSRATSYVERKLRFHGRRLGTLGEPYAPHERAMLRDGGTPNRYPPIGVATGQGAIGQVVAGVVTISYDEPADEVAQRRLQVIRLRNARRGVRS